MKNILNAISAILIILFLGWMVCGDCCEKKCEKSGSTKCDYSKCERSGATKCDYSKCKKTGTKKECPHANNEEIGFTEEEIEQLQLETDISDKLEDEELLDEELLDE